MPLFRRFGVASRGRQKHGSTDRARKCFRIVPTESFGNDNHAEDVASSIPFDYREILTCPIIRKPGLHGTAKWLSTLTRERKPERRLPVSIVRS